MSEIDHGDVSHLISFSFRDYTFFLALSSSFSSAGVPVPVIIRADSLSADAKPLLSLDITTDRRRSKI